MKLNKGDVVWVDNAALIASPQRTGHTTMCTVLQDSPNEASQVYVEPYNGSPLYVFKTWLGEPDNFKSGKKS